MNITKIFQTPGQTDDWVIAGSVSNRQNYKLIKNTAIFAENLNVRIKTTSSNKHSHKTYEIIFVSHIGIAVFFLLFFLLICSQVSLIHLQRYYSTLQSNFL